MEISPIRSISRGYINNICPILQQGAVPRVIGTLFSCGFGDLAPEVFHFLELLNHGRDHVIEFVRIAGLEVEGVRAMNLSMR